MPGITNTTTAVKAIFALDIITAILAFVLFIAATVIVLTRIANGRIRSFTRSSGAGPLKTTLSTHLFLIPALLFLTLAYAIQSAVVALQAKSASLASVTSAFDYNYTSDLSSSASISTSTISALSFTQQLASILFSVFLTAAVWLHSNNLTTNGTNVNSPGTFSRIWNTVIIIAILVFGLAAWGQGLSARGSGHNALSFSDTISNDRITRILFVVFRCVVIYTSTSVSIEVVRNYLNLNKNGAAGNIERPLLARFTFVVVPLIWMRNLFIIVNIVMIYENVSNWSSSANQALAFLFIIFGQLTNLTILFMVLWGAWSMGRSAGKAPSNDY